jgi:hypothetical protein
MPFVMVETCPHCEQRGNRWFLCPYHEGYRDGTEDARADSNSDALIVETDDEEPFNEDDSISYPLIDWRAEIRRTTAELKNRVPRVHHIQEEAR